MTSRIILLLLATIAAVVSTASTGHSGASQATVLVDTNPFTSGVQASRPLPPGITATYLIAVADVQDLQAFNFEIVYDEQIVTSPTISVGSDLDRNPDAEETFLTSTGRSWSCSPPAPSGDTDPDANVGVAFLSCFSTGAVPGPNAGASAVPIAEITYTIVGANAASTPLTLRNVNLFAAGGVELGSCNPITVTEALCSGGSIVVDDNVGGIAELPEVAGMPLETAGPSSAGVLLGAAAAAATGVTLSGIAWHKSRRRHAAR